FCHAEDGIRDRNVTGVQTCALPICSGRSGEGWDLHPSPDTAIQFQRPSIIRMLSVVTPKTIHQAVFSPVQCERVSCVLVGLGEVSLVMVPSCSVLPDVALPPGEHCNCDEYKRDNTDLTNSVLCDHGYSFLNRVFSHSLV